MELDEKLDKNYKKDREAYNKTQRLSQNIKDLEQQLKMLKRAIEDAERKQIRAKEDGETSVEEEAQTEIKSKVEETKKVQAKLDKIKEVIEKNKSKVDGYIEELKKEPGFEEHVNSILEKRYNRQLAKALKEEQQVNTILDLCQNHPTLANNLRGMVRAQEELDKLNKEIESLDPEKDKDKLDEIYDKIDELDSKKNLNMNTFMAYCTKNHVNVDKKFLEKLISEKSFAHNKLGNSNENKTQPTTKLDRLTSDPMQGTGPKAQPPVSKFKWYEFRKRFNAWRERRKAEKETETERDLDLNLDSDSDIPAEKGSINIEKTLKNMSKGYKKRILAYQATIDRIQNAKISAKNEEKCSTSEKFRDSYKYDVVKDYVDKTEKEIYKESLKDVKQALKDDSEQER